MDFTGFAYSLPSWTSMLIWTFILFWTLGEGGIIGSSEPIVAAPRDDVILPCQLDPAIDAHSLTVEWSRPDLKPDPSQSRVYYVHLYRYRREVLDLKLPSYVNRTQLFTEELKRGNMSLKILNVTSADTGTYRCFIPNLWEHAAIQLIVDPDLKTRTTETPSYPGDLQTPDPRNKTDDEEVDQTRDSVWILPLVFFFLLVLTLIITGFLIKRRRQNQTQKQNHDVECDVALKTPP